MENEMQALMEQIESFTEEFNNINKGEGKINKSAAKRARQKSIELRKSLKAWRELSIQSHR